MPLPDKVVEGIRKAGGSAIRIVPEPSDPAAPMHVLAAAITAFGQVDVMVNDAGSGDRAAIEEASDGHVAQITAMSLVDVFR